METESLLFETDHSITSVTPNLVSSVAEQPAEVVQVSAQANLVSTTVQTENHSAMLIQIYVMTFREF